MGFIFSNSGPGTEAVTLAPAGQGVEDVFGVSLAAPDVLDLSAVASAAGIHLDLTNIGSYFSTVAAAGGTALNFDPTGHGGGSALALLQGVNTDMQALVNSHALRLS